MRKSARGENQVLRVPHVDTFAELSGLNHLAEGDICQVTGDRMYRWFQGSWTPVGEGAALAPLTFALDLWCDSVDGLDTNPGTQVKPFKTLERALRERLKYGVIRAGVICAIHLVGYGPYQWVNLGSSKADYGGRLIIQGESKYVAATLNKTSTISNFTFTTNQADATNYRDWFMRYLDGAGRGQTLHIESSGVGTMSVLTGAYSMTDYTGQIEVFRPGTHISFPTNITTLDSDAYSHVFRNLYFDNTFNLLSCSAVVTCCYAAEYVLCGVLSTIYGFGSFLTPAELGAAAEYVNPAALISTPGVIGAGLSLSHYSRFQGVFTQLKNSTLDSGVNYYSVLAACMSLRRILQFANSSTTLLHRVVFSGAASIIGQRSSNFQVQASNSFGGGNGHSGTTTALYLFDLEDSCNITAPAGTFANLTGSFHFGVETLVLPVATATNRKAYSQIYIPHEYAFGAAETNTTKTEVIAQPAIVEPAMLGSQGFVSPAPSAQTDFTLLRNGVTMGTVRFASGSQTPTFILTLAFTLLAGQRLEILSPANLNGITQANITIRTIQL